MLIATDNDNDFQLHFHHCLKGREGIDDISVIDLTDFFLLFFIDFTGYYLDSYLIGYYWR